MTEIIRSIQSNIPAVLWLTATIILVVIESSTAQMVCIWFALGSFAAVFAAMAGAPLLVQFLIFVGISAVTLIFTRRFVVDMLKVKKTATNADSVIGLCGSVIQDIDNLAETGRIRVNGLDWAARTADNTIVHIGEAVTVQAIVGVKLIVIRR